MEERWMTGAGAKDQHIYDGNGFGLREVYTMCGLVLVDADDCNDPAVRACGKCMRLSTTREDVDADESVWALREIALLCALVNRGRREPLVWVSLDDFDDVVVSTPRGSTTMESWDDGRTFVHGMVQGLELVGVEVPWGTLAARMA